jgi:hypothetical protein
MLVMVKYLFLKFKKRIESELKKRIWRAQLTNLYKLTNKKNIHGYECCIRLNVGGNLRNFSVFLQAGFTLLVRLDSKNAGNIIMKNLMDFVSVPSDFGQLDTIMYGDISSFKPNLFFWRCKDCTVCFFQTVFAAAQ